MRKTPYNPASVKQDPTCISPCGQKISWGAYFKLCTQQIYFIILSSWPEPFTFPKKLEFNWYKIPQLMSLSIVSSLFTG